RTLLLLVSGLGLLQMKRWGRSLAFAYVVLGLLGTVAEVAYQVAVTVPVTKKWEEQRNAKLKANGMTPPPSTVQFTAAASVGVAGFCGGVYPLVVLGLLLAPSGRKMGASVPADDRDHDEEDDLDAERPLLRRPRDEEPPREGDDRFRD